ncbi:hypothetical protein C1N91_08105 [Curtobacterium sp. SGAir0471]|uniref:hypothetical protein n=1 Tax=Curtobacterium sp. SGAir0471 TaxID=2070337 RepID=UPI0010CCB793|nr:hypothetical protein [Curtobacterium sp. SGAir0471]QCR43514.1 hypothetical protein C1N91_08105 [Curtobacterium sp. SGAir0471]
MADEDVTAERARLEALAWGAGVEPEVAARARLALRDLEGTGNSADHATIRGATSPAVMPDATQPAPAPAAVPDATRPAPAAVPDATRPAPAAVPDATRPAPEADAPRTVTGPGKAAADGRPTTGPGAVPDGGGMGLPAGRPTWRTRASGLLWTARPRVWIALGAAVVVGLAFAAGTLVGTSDGQRVAAPSTTPTPGAITLEELLDIPQTYADQLPGPVEAPVSLRSTRLVFTNRALDGSSFETPWNVWAGVGTDRETICLVATANRLESTTACYPREDALHGNVSLSAQSTSGTLTITLRGGGVQGTVTNEN